MNVVLLRKQLYTLANPQKALILRRFFKTGKGEYAEGDKFLGIIVPETRKVARQYRNLPLSDIAVLMKSEFHEERLAALLILVDQFKQSHLAGKTAIYKLYLAHTAYINNWDLVDLSAEYIVGAYLENRAKAPLTKLARSTILWERRIAILATFHFIKQGDPAEALRITKILLHDTHDLIHKAVGWMLREVGKRCSREAEEAFLREHYQAMPRTMLRYAIEQFPPKLKTKYMTGKI